MKILTLEQGPAAPANQKTLHPDNVESIDTTNPKRWIVTMVSGAAYPCAPSAALAEWADAELPKPEKKPGT